jgi:hypothetical protein
MSVASLSKFTVPLSTNQSASAQGLLMPKLAYRFRITFLNFGRDQQVTELTKQVMDFTRPTVSFDEITVDTYNSRVKLIGKPAWQDVTINLRDDASGQVSKLIGQQLQKQFDFLEQASARSGSIYKFTTKCEMLDGGNGRQSPTVLETWELYGCLLSQVNYGELNYTTNDPVKIALTMKYDNAIQTEGVAGVGTSFARAINREDITGGGFTSSAG